MDPGDTGFDLDSSMDAIASEMVKDDTPDTGVDTSTDTGSTLQTDTTQQQPVVRAAPKSWGKEHHERWSKLDKETQDYIELREKQSLDGITQYSNEAKYAKQFREAITPYQQHLQTLGVSEFEAVQYLLNANQKLTTGTPEERRQVYQQLGQDLGLLEQANQNPGAMDPEIKQLKSQVSTLISASEAQQRAAQQQARQKADSELSAFAADPANAHFKDVAADMLIYVKAGMPLTDAYDKAVWANPVTRQKEQVKVQTELEAKLKAKAKEDADTARRASGTNVRGANTQQAPTEPKGSMEDTLRSELKKIRSRA